MELKKKLTEQELAVAQYTDKGIALRVNAKGDRYMNAVAIIETVNGKLRLTLFDDAIKRYGIEVASETINPKVW